MSWFEETESADAETLAGHKRAAPAPLALTEDRLGERTAVQLWISY